MSNPYQAEHQHKSPCGECIFRRDSKPGELGGTPIYTCIGQTHGQFLIPCRASKECGEKNPEVGVDSECAGLAIFRANVGRSELMPEPLLHLPPDHETVFSSYAELMAHHTNIRVDVAEWTLSRITPQELMEKEMGKANIPLVVIEMAPDMPGGGGPIDGE